MRGGGRPWGSSRRGAFDAGDSREARNGGENMLTVSVKDFGPIKEGTVELKPLTIFVGPSNTGKSYMAGAIYALMKGFEGAYVDSFLRIGSGAHRSLWDRSPNSFRVPLEIEDPTEPVSNSLRNWITQVGGSLDEDTPIKVLDLPAEVQTFLERSTKETLNEFCDDVTKNLRHYHGDEQDFARNGAIDDFGIAIRQDSPLLNLNINLSEKSTSPPDVDISKFEIPLPVIQFRDFRGDFDLDHRELGQFYSWLFGSVVRSVLEGLPKKSYYLPAARSGMVQSHKVLSASLIQQSSRIGLQPLSFPTLPGITIDFLSLLISLDARVGNRKDEPAMADAISYIENAVLGGQIDFDNSSGLPFPDIAYYKGVGDEPKKKFLINNSSSMVSELAPVVLFLKYLVRPGDLLIFEEPESHLHPAAQRRLARGIARLVNAGVRVLITTHSDTFVSQINNLIGLGQASAGFISEHNLQPQEFLTLDQVGAYLFSIGQDGDGSGVRPLEIDPDTGIDEDEFADVFEAIYEESIALQRDRS